MIWVTLLALLTSVKSESSGSYTIYHGGQIITMEFEGAEVEAVVEQGGKIVFAGDKATADADFGALADTEYVDLQGNVMMPGFIEPHVHPLIAAVVLANEIIAPYSWETPTITTVGREDKDSFRLALSEAIEANARREREKGPDEEAEMFLVWGYTQYWHEELSKEYLNSLDSVNAVGIIHRSFHEIYINDAAVDFLGINEDMFADDPQVDWDMGHFWEHGWMLLAPYLNNVFMGAKYPGGLRAMSWLFQKNGIIAGSEPGVPNSDLNFEMETLKAELDRGVPYDFYLVPNANFWTDRHHGNHTAAMEYIESMPDDPELNNDRVRFVRKNVKMFADGAIYSLLSQFTDGYTDGHEGQWITPEEEFVQMVKLYWDNDFKIHVHCNGDEGLRLVLDGVRQAYADNPRENHGFTAQHLAYFHEDQALEMAQLGMEASVNPYYLWALADKYSQVGLDEARAQRMVPLKYLTDNDIPVSFHSDFSMAPAEPLTLAWTAVNRVTSQGNTFSEDQKITVWDAMKAVTIGAARTLDLTEELGTIVPGKDASFVVLDSSPWDRPTTMNEIEVLQVVHRGKLYDNIELTGCSVDLEYRMLLNKSARFTKFPVSGNFKLSPNPENIYEASCTCYTLCKVNENPAYWQVRVSGRSKSYKCSCYSFGAHGVRSGKARNVRTKPMGAIGGYSESLHNNLL